MSSMKFGVIAPLWMPATFGQKDAKECLKKSRRLCVRRDLHFIEFINLLDTNYWLVVFH